MYQYFLISLHNPEMTRVKTSPWYRFHLLQDTSQHLRDEKDPSMLVGHNRGLKTYNF